MPFALKITRPLPSTLPALTMQIDPLLTSLTVASGLPGGYMALAVGMPDASVPRNVSLPQPVDLVEFGHVELWAGSTCLHEGRAMKFHMPGGEVRGFVTVGYGLSATADDYYTSTSANVQQLTSGLVLQEVLTRAPLLSISTKPGEWVDPGLTHTRAEMDGKLPYEVINQLSTEGGTLAGTAAPWDWAVWERRVASWKPRLPPAQPQYQQSLADVVIEKDLTNLYGTVAVSYGPSKTRTPEATDPTFLPRYGFRRAINLQGSNVSATSAAQFRDTHAALHSAPEYAITIAYSDDHGPRLRSGSEQKPWLVRAGEWLVVGDLPPFVIIHTVYDAMARTLQLVVGALPRDAYRRSLEAWRSAAFLARLTNPTTGASL